MLTAEQIVEIRDYWSLPAPQRDVRVRFRTWPIRNACDDIAALLDHIATVQGAAQALGLDEAEVAHVLADAEVVE